MELRAEIKKSADVLRKLGIPQVGQALILGTGLGKLIDEIEVERIIDYSSIPGFAIPTVETHDGRFVYGKLAGKDILAMDGRLHYYEGYSMKDITYPIYVLKEIGVDHLFVSNAAGNLNPSWSKGDLMLFDDHINLLPDNPLRGPNDRDLGPRWPDMFRPYSQKLNELLKVTSKEVGIELRSGIYASVQGPNLETRAEYKMLRSMGADAVGMSTVPEVIVANYLGMEVCAISVLTDDCDPKRLAPVNIRDILEIAGKAELKLNDLIRQSINKI